MLLKQALALAVQQLESSDVGSPRLNAETLLMFVLGVNRAYLYAHPERELTGEEQARYDEVIAQRAKAIPSQYITGHQEFWGLDFEVTPDVLIPRPETEHVVEAVVDLSRHFGSEARAALRIAEIGTGSGCIALALASEFPHAEIYATDISHPALEVAARNAVRLGLEGRVRFLEGDLLAPLLDTGLAGTLDFVASNPPYVAQTELDMVQREVREFEPRTAWGGLEHGEQVYARLFPQALEALRPGGYVVVEIGYNMCDRVSALLGESWTATEVRPDLAGIPRVVIARKALDGP